MLKIDALAVGAREAALAELRRAEPRVLLAVGELGPAASWAVPALRQLRDRSAEPIRTLASESLAAIEQKKK